MCNSQRKIVFATNNAHKLEEIRKIMGNNWCVLSLADIGCFDDIPETATTLQGNAEIKARYVKEHFGYDCFADDTGLMVDALNGDPGVYSARYAGNNHDSVANTALLLKNLEGKTNRNAHFSTIIALLLGDKMHIFEGSVHGIITETPDGDGGFGYDPVFKPNESDVTFARMSAADKNSISHRGRATEKLMVFLSSLNNKK